MKTLFQMAAAFVIGFMITATISNYIPANSWYSVLEFKSTGRTLMLSGPYVSKIDCETNPAVVKYIEAGQKSDSNVKCVNKLPDIR